MLNKRKLKEFTKKVDTLLWQEWDPIGCGVPEDEYTSYALFVAGKAWNGVDKQVILDYLYWAENENMGLSCKKEEASLKNGPIVDKIMQLASEYKLRA